MTTRSERNALPLIDQWLRFACWYHEIPSLAVGIRIGDHTFTRGYGLKDLKTRDPVTAQTLYRIASHSKLFTACAVMRLFEQERLRLDDPVSTHLDWFNSASDANMRSLTLRELLSHASGLTRDGTTGHWLNDTFPDVDSIRSQAANGLSVFGAAEHWKYSNMGFALLGCVVEAVAGQPFEAAVSELVLKPIGLRNTTPDFDDASGPLHATGYGIRYPGQPREVFRHVHARAMNAATGFSSNIDDLLRFYEHHKFGNTTLLTDRSKREMQRLQFEDGAIAWGLGFRIDKSLTGQTVGHDGAYPGFMTSSMLDQGNDITVVVLTSAMDGQPQYFLQGIRNLLAYAASPVTSEAGGPTETSSDDARFIDSIAGYFGSRWGISIVNQLDGKLVMFPTNAPLPGDAIMRWDHLGDHHFKAVDGPKNGEFGETSEIVRVGDEWRIRSGIGEQRPFHIPVGP